MPEPIAHIRQLCAQLTAETDREHWQVAQELMAEIDALLRAPENEGVFDRATLLAAQAAVQRALQDTERRRQEVGHLVNALGGNLDLS